MKQYLLFTIILLLLANFVQCETTSSIPQYINYQGMLTNAEGQPLETKEYKLTFKIFNKPTDGSAVWGPQIFDGVYTAGHGAKVPVVRGHFNVILGPTDTEERSITEAFQTNNAFLEISVENNAPISPRLQILSVPYAVKAEKAKTVVNGAITNHKIADHSIGVEKLNFSDDSGNVSFSGNLELNGNIWFKGGNGPFCIFSTECPDGWKQKGEVGFIATKCPYRIGGTYGGVWIWCHPMLCCNE